MADKKWGQVDKAFDFFTTRFDKGELFSLTELADFTGWSASTVRTYYRKKWRKFIIPVSGKYQVTEIIKGLTKESFRQHQSQNEGETEKQLHDLMLDKAVSACVSAIEIYNKPNFEHREETFSILMVNAWELLLKSKLVSNAGGNAAAIHIFKKNGDPILSDTGNPRTITARGALKALVETKEISKVIEDNVTALLNIRDDSVHFACDDPELSVVVQEVGMASLHNFMTLAMNWYRYDFSKFNFYLMPVSFFHLSDMRSFSVDNNVKNNLLHYLKMIEREHENDEDANYAVSLKLHTKLVKTTGDEALQVRLTDDPDAPEIVLSEEEALKSYPFDYAELLTLFRKRYSNFKQNGEFNARMREVKAAGEKFSKVRRLDPENPKSLSKTFYHNRILEKFDMWYEKVK
ncbi:DUF3644 domain-containing protein [Vibrio hyugaensis]|uniref:DUF3644 domain-containing protein n=1 Tax=Vibrio hyugaensis TaxID=1534743 RepID=UPI003D9FBD21